MVVGKTSLCRIKEVRFPARCLPIPTTLSFHLSILLIAEMDTFTPVTMIPTVSSMTSTRASASLLLLAFDYPEESEAEPVFTNSERPGTGNGFFTFCTIAWCSANITGSKRYRQLGMQPLWYVFRLLQHSTRSLILILYSRILHAQPEITLLFTLPDIAGINMPFG